ncbi:MAG: hypothetical protein KDK23_01900, partial [Leptospiraceae bacterium]|nr:hypothetical protein [Leptospiraceae bacterium]
MEGGSRKDRPPEYEVMARPLETVVHIAHHQFFVQDAEARWDGQFRNNPWAQEGPGVADGLLGVLSPRAAGPAPV